jgi:tRNA(adenine34) deaminase
MKKALQEAEMAFDKGEIPLGLLLSSMIVIARSHNLTELLTTLLLMPKCKRSPLRQII